MDFLFSMRCIEFIVMIFDTFFALYVFLRFKFYGSMRILLLNLIIGLPLTITIFREYFLFDIIEKAYYLGAINHFLLLSIFILKTMPSSHKNCFWKYFIGIWFSILCFLIYINSYRNWAPIGAFSNSGLLILTLAYYNKLFSDKTQFVIFSNAGFWAITGIFVCATVALPLTAFYYFLLSKKILDEQVFNNIYAIGAVAYTILHLFFIKAFSCLLPNRKSYAI